MSHITARSRVAHPPPPGRSQPAPVPPSRRSQRFPLCPRCHARALTSDELQTKRGEETLAAVGGTGCIKILESDLWPTSIASSRQTVLCKQTALPASLSTVPLRWLTGKAYKAIISPHQSKRKRSWEIPPLTHLLPRCHPTPPSRVSPQRAHSPEIRKPGSEIRGYRSPESGRNVLVSVRAVSRCCLLITFMDVKVFRGNEVAPTEELRFWGGGIQTM